MEFGDRFFAGQFFYWVEKERRWETAKEPMARVTPPPPGQEEKIWCVEVPSRGIKQGFRGPAAEWDAFNLAAGNPYKIKYLFAA